jgi:hypothetical protein
MPWTLLLVCLIIITLAGTSTAAALALFANGKLSKLYTRVRLWVLEWEIDVER